MVEDLLKEKREKILAEIDRKNKEKKEKIAKQKANEREENLKLHFKAVEEFKKKNPNKELAKRKFKRGNGEWELLEVCVLAEEYEGDYKYPSESEIRRKNWEEKNKWYEKRLKAGLIKEKPPIKWLTGKAYEDWKKSVEGKKVLFDESKKRGGFGNWYKDSREKK